MKKLLLALIFIASPVFATVTDTTDGRATLIADGSAKVYVFTFPVYVASYISAAITTQGAPISITYTVALNGDQANTPGGSVTFTSAPPAGATVEIDRTLPFDQQLSLPQFSPFPAKAVERQFDTLVEQIQQLDRNAVDLSAKEHADFLALLNPSGATVGSNTLVIPGSGTVSSTIAALFAQNCAAMPSWYGALGNGVHDDTLAFQQAAAAAAGKTLCIPPPAVSYRLTDSIAISTDGSKILGANSKLFMDFAPNHATGRLFFVTASNVEFRGVWIDGTGASTVGTITNHYGIRWAGSSTHLSNAKVINCRFTNLPWADNFGAVTATHALYFNQVDHVRVEDSIFDGPSGAAVFLSGLFDAIVANNYINNTGWYSIQLNDSVDGAHLYGNRITGTVLGGRVWGGSFNFMSNSSTGVNCGTPGCARIKNVEVDHNYISGLHSYTAAVHIESCSNINFHNNIMEKISLTTGSPFFPDGTPPDYIRVYVRPTNVPPTGNEGPNDHITIEDNDLIANGPDGIAIYIDAQDNGSGTLGYSDTIVVRNNRVRSLNTSNYFAKCIIAHGQQGGIKNLVISGNKCSGFPSTSVPVSGLVGAAGLTAAPVIDGTITDNSIELLGGTPTGSTNVGLALDTFTQRFQVRGNSIRGFWHGFRMLTDSGPVYVGPGNVFNGNVNADTLFAAGSWPSAFTSGTTPSIVTPLLVSARSANLTATTVASLVDSGEYRVCVNARTTFAGTGTSATLNILWTGDGGSKTHAVGTWALNAVDSTGQINACDFVHTDASTNIQVSTSGGTYGTSTYVMTATVEKIR